MELYTTNWGGRYIRAWNKAVGEINPRDFRLTADGEVKPIETVDTEEVAVEEQIVKLKELYLDYEFSAVYGGK